MIYFLRHIRANFLVIIAAIAIAACSSDSGWQLKGSIYGITDSLPDYATLEGQNKLGGWYVIDTLSLNSDGSFTASGTAPAYPEIYRINYNGKSVYFPVDSIDHLQFSTNVEAFDRAYTLSGSDNAARIALVDSLIYAFIGQKGLQALDTASALKRRIADIVLINPAGIVAYYIVNKTIDGHPLLNLDNKPDLRIYGAVANAFSEQRPSDPRCRLLSDIYIQNMKRNTTQRDTIVANEIGLIDIELPDASGKTVKLSDIADKNKVVVLNFTSYSQDFSAPLNIELRKIYDRFHASGMEIYQVGIDNEAVSDNFQWRQAARNLPWTTVYNGTRTDYISTYNVPAVPAMFVISGSTIVSRPANVSELTSALSNLLAR